MISHRENPIQEKILLDSITIGQGIKSLSAKFLKKSKMVRDVDKREDNNNMSDILFMHFSKHLSVNSNFSSLKCCSKFRVEFLVINVDELSGIHIGHYEYSLSFGHLIEIGEKKLY